VAPLIRTTKTDQGGSGRRVVSDPNHIRGNVVGYVALFLVVTGGTAQALNGSNTVFSDDIVNREVKNADLGLAAVTANRLAPNSVRTGRVVDESLTGDDVANTSINGAEIDEGAVSLSGDVRGLMSNTSLGPGVVNSVNVGTDTLMGYNIDESTLNASTPTPSTVSLRGRAATT